MILNRGINIKEMPHSRFIKSDGPRSFPDFWPRLLFSFLRFPAFLRYQAHCRILHLNFYFQHWILLLVCCQNLDSSWMFPVPIFVLLKGIIIAQIINFHTAKLFIDLLLCICDYNMYSAEVNHKFRHDISNITFIIFMIIIYRINDSRSIDICLIYNLQIVIIIFLPLSSLSHRRALFHNILFSHIPVFIQDRFIFMCTNDSVSTFHRKLLSQCNPLRQTSLLKHDSDSLMPCVIKSYHFIMKMIFEFISQIPF